MDEVDDVLDRLAAELETAGRADRRARGAAATQPEPTRPTEATRADRCRTRPDAWPSSSSPRTSTRPPSGSGSALADWDLHERVDAAHPGRPGGRGRGETIEAFTGVGRFGFLDRMTIIVWEPPRRAVVRHTGRVVRGSGAFEVTRAAPERSRGRLVGVGRPAARSARAGSAGRWCGRCVRAGVPVLAAPARALRRGRPRDAAVVVGADGLARCPWGAGTPDYVRLPRRRVGPAGARRRRRCSSGSASRRSSPACRGSRSCASGRRSGRRSPASTRRGSRRSATTTSSG